MTRGHDLARGHARLRCLIEYVLREGWAVERIAGGHLKFVKPGLPPIYTSALVSNDRDVRNAGAPSHQAECQPPTLTGRPIARGCRDG